jgi:hypothetical protein|tara:strand:- start:1076 stop:1273 length:198 start_codon:yes stop_codon:yes gene_type:complete
MTLEEYIKEKKIKIEDLAEEINEPHHRNVYRYMRNVIPRPDKMELIYRITEGQVTPNDFYKFMRQ